MIADPKNLNLIYYYFGSNPYYMVCSQQINVASLVQEPIRQVIY